MGWTRIVKDFEQVSHGFLLGCALRRCVLKHHGYCEGQGLLQYGHNVPTAKDVPCYC